MLSRLGRRAWVQEIDCENLSRARISIYLRSLGSRHGHQNLLTIVATVYEEQSLSIAVFDHLMCLVTVFDYSWLKDVVETGTVWLL